MENYKKILRNKIINKTLSVGIIGLGYVGLPLTILLSKHVSNVYGFDSDKKKIQKLKKNISYINRIDNK